MVYATVRASLFRFWEVSSGDCDWWLGLVPIFLFAISNDELLRTPHANRGTGIFVHRGSCDDPLHGPSISHFS